MTKSDTKVGEKIYFSQSLQYLPKGKNIILEGGGGRIRFFGKIYTPACTIYSRASNTSATGNKRLQL